MIFYKNVKFVTKNYDKKNKKQKVQVEMVNFYYPKINLTGRIQNSGMNLDLNSIPSINTESNELKTNFKDVISGLANGLNQDLSAPDELLKGVMKGDGSVDIHDVMTAMAKAEISVSVATQLTSKVIQAYDKIMQISV